MTCQIETVTYPSWWGGASTVRVKSANAGSVITEFTGSRADVELLPEGVSFPSKLVSWTYVFSVELVS